MRWNRSSLLLHFSDHNYNDLLVLNFVATEMCFKSGDALASRPEEASELKRHPAIIIVYIFIS